MLQILTPGFLSEFTLETHCMHFPIILSQVCFIKVFEIKSWKYACASAFAFPSIFEIELSSNEVQPNLKMLSALIIYILYYFGQGY